MSDWREELESQITKTLDEESWDPGDYPKTRRISVRFERAILPVILKLRAGEGSVNEGAFCGAQPGTLLLSGYSSKSNDDNVTGSGTLIFALREKNWNYAPNPGGGWDHVV